MPSKQKLLAAILSVVVIVGSVAVWQLWRHQQRAALALAAIPSIPEVSNWPDEFVQKLNTATAAAVRTPRPESWLAELARLYLANGFSDEAERLLRSLVKLQPREPRWFYYLADLRQTAGDFDEAFQLLRKTIQLQPDYAAAHFKLGELLSKRGRFEEASEYYHRRLALLPGDPYARLSLARVAMQQGDEEAARTRLEGIVKDHPNFPSAINLLADFEVQAGNDQRAEELRGRGHRAGRFREAPDEWQEELYSWYYDPHRLQVLASIFEQTGRLEQSLPFLEKAVQLAPEDGDAYEDLGKTLILLQRFGDAREVLERGMAVDPEEQSLYSTLPLALRKLGLTQSAITILKRGVQLFPEVADLHNYLGIAYDEAHNPTAAVTAYRSALQVDPNHIEANLNLGKSLIELGDETAGMSFVQHALDIEPWNIDALIYVAGREIDAEDLDQADTHLRSLEQLAPDRPDVRQLRAFWYLRRGRAAAVAGRTEDAIQDFVAGAKVDPTVGELHGNLGVILAQDGHFSEAAVAFSRFVTAAPNDPVAYLYLGGALGRVGQTEEAQRAFRAGLEVARKIGDQEAVQRFTTILEQADAD